MLFHIFVQNIYSSKSQIQQFTRLICQRLYKKPTTFHQAKTKSANQASIKCQQKQTPKQKKQKKETSRTIESIVLHVLICLMFSYIALYSFILPCTFCSPKQCVCLLHTNRCRLASATRHAWLASWQDGAFRTKSGKEIKRCSKYPAPLPIPRHVLFHNLYRFRHNR